MSGWCRVCKMKIRPCYKCGREKTIRGQYVNDAKKHVRRNHEHVCTPCEPTCWACGHPLSVVALGALCGRCKREHRLNGYVKYRQLPPPSQDWPRCEEWPCRVRLNPRYGQPYCLFHSEIMEEVV